MNERIEKLSIKANAQTGYEFDLNHKPLDDFLTKFAELIVQECIGVLADRDMGDLNREDMEVRRCVRDVKQHFEIK